MYWITVNSCLSVTTVSEQPFNSLQLPVAILCTSPSEYQVNPWCLFSWYLLTCSEGSDQQHPSNIWCTSTLAGRTYNDLMQYPIFPWVIADYKSEVSCVTSRWSSYTPLVVFILYHKYVTFLNAHMHIHTRVYVHTHTRTHTRTHTYIAIFFTKLI